MCTPRFKLDQIPELASRYADDDHAVEQIGRRAKVARRYCREDFLAVCNWKSARSQSRCQRNSSQDVSDITHVALTTPNEKLRIGALMCLVGVAWPTASVLLHFAHSAPYPKLDVRALWLLEVEKPSNYTFEFWWKYVETCRSLAHIANVDMRTLDRALWQYSRENQAKIS